ncbi:MAG: gliding motility-associated C-terminal domain-containing protein, partial [Bacteroidales bacterium]|nr:gliding motility-associated C-terminal domain-containing protein [Bacteroidales bacterium]
YNTVDSATICDGDIFVFGTQNLDTAGVYTEVFASVDGCDSTVVLTLNVNPIYNTVDSATICDGDIFVFGTQNLDTAGVYTEVFVSVDGCDSTVVLTLNVNPVFNTVDSATICDGDVFLFGTQTLNTAGAYTELYTTVDGCDSTVVLNLTVNPIYFSVDSATICDGDVFTFGAQSLSTTGTYTEVFITVDGCDSTVVLSLFVNPLPIVDLGVDTGICEGDSIILSAGNFASYLWSDGSNLSTLNVDSTSSVWVNVFDALGCTGSDTINITVNNLPIFDLGSDTVNCLGGSILLNAGVWNTYVWNTLETTQSIFADTSGVYFVTVIDSLGCANSDTISVSISSEIISNLSVANVLCFGDSTGSITTTISGGSSPFLFIWDQGSSDQNLMNIPAGNYSITISDQYNCQALDSAIVLQPNVLLDSMVISDVLCYGDSTGSIDLSVYGGTMPYSYFWNTNETTEDLSNLATGTYLVTVTDGNGCIVVDTTLITQPDELLLSASIIDNLCYGDSAGSIEITLSGGVSPYAILWNTLADSTFIDSLPAQDYIVIVTDSNLCQLMDTISVMQPDSIQLIFAATNVLCPSDSTGAIDMTVIGGIPPYSYYWNTTDTTEDISGYPAGEYYVTVTDSLGCQRIDTISITAPVFYASFAVTHLSCNGTANGAVNLTVVGGIAPFTYIWTGGSTTEDLTGLSGGVYAVTITDATGCSIMDQVSVVEPNVVNLSLAVTNVSCYGLTDGAIDLTVTGGTLPYSYSWSGPVTAITQDLSGIPAGFYNVVMFDGNFCISMINTIVTSPTEIISSPLIQNVSCFGLNDGSVSISVSGGIFPYEYLWSNNDTVANIDSLIAGTYQVTITDTSSCQVSLSYTVTEPNALVSSLVGTDVECYGENNGNANLSVSGGTAPYNFTWLSGQSTEDIFGLPAGNYYVTITDFYGCQITDSVIIDEPEFPLLATSEVTHVSCYGGFNGSIDLTTTGGTPPYEFWWPSIPANTEDVTGLMEGYYNVFIIDSMGCEFETEVYVSQPLFGIQINVTMGSVSCFGGSDGFVALNVVGGTSPYTYQWLTQGTNDSISGLPMGNYFVTVTDSLGCQEFEVIGISQPDPLSLQFINTDVNCFGGNDGFVNLTVNGGTSPFDFTWSNGQSTEDISTLIADSYAVTIVDANGCATQDTTIITEPAQPINAVLQGTDVNCTGGTDGSIVTTVTGGTAPYSFLWSNTSTLQNLTNLESGTYILTITDDNLCLFTVSIYISQPLYALEAIAISSNITCYGYDNGEILVNAIGGTSPYSYIWSTNDTTNFVNNLSPGTYTISVYDDHGCPEVVTTEIIEPEQIQTAYLLTEVLCYGDSTGLIDMTVTGGSTPYSYVWSNANPYQDNLLVPAGWYYVTITDNQNCVATDSIELAEPSNPIELSLTGYDLNCQNDHSGTVQCNLTGGTFPYLYSWSTGATTEYIDSLPSGTYYITVTDQNGCKQIDTAEVSAPIQIEADMYVLSDYNGFDVSCYGADDGIVNIEIFQGTEPYHVQWSNGGTDQYVDNVSAGIYVIQIFDDAGCIFRDTLQLVQPTELHVSPTAISPNCPDVSDGSIQLNVNGGNPPYSYVWSTLEYTEDILNLDVGTYTVTISDMNGCVFYYSDDLDYQYQECLFIPSAITPNADGYNDVWQIRGVELYPKMYIEIYDRWGQVMFKSDKGYKQKWDGTYEGKDLPIDTYYYVIQLNEGTEPIIGQITIVR